MRNTTKNWQELILKALESGPLSQSDLANAVWQAHYAPNADKRQVRAMAFDPKFAEKTKNQKNSIIASLPEFVRQGLVRTCGHPFDVRQVKYEITNLGKSKLSTNAS